jgi:uncharacterized delta-60 repeat protein
VNVGTRWLALVLATAGLSPATACGGRGAGVEPNVEPEAGADAQVSMADGAGDAGDPAPDAPVEVRGAAGDPDPRFGAGGAIEGAMTWIPAGVGAGADGSLTVAGFSNGTLSPPLEIVRRFTVTGDRDPSFGGGEDVTLASAPGPFRQSVAVLASGATIVLGAGSPSGSDGAFVARLGADGAPDPAFGAAGVVALSTIGHGTGGLVGPGGDTFAFGSDATVHLRADGSLDPAFAVHGALPGSAAGAFGPGGTLVASDGAHLARYLADGSLDPTFASGGVASWGDPGDAGLGRTVRAIVLDATGRIVVAGTHAEGGVSYADVARFDSRGAVDATFGAGGTTTVATNAPVGAAVLASGLIVVWTEHGQLLRLDDHGAIDTAFGYSGIAELEVLGTVLGGVVDAEQRLVVVGFTSDTSPGLWYVRRYWL